MREPKHELLVKDEMNDQSPELQDGREATGNTPVGGGKAVARPGTNKCDKLSPQEIAIKVGIAIIGFVIGLIVGNA